MNIDQLTLDYSDKLNLIPKKLVNTRFNDYFRCRNLVEYLLIISPPDLIKDDVRGYKNFLADNIGSYKSRNSIAHLSLLSFDMYMNVEDENILLQRLQAIAAEQNVAEFTLNRFKAFAKSNTVYLEVLEKEIFARISKNFNKKSLFYNLYIQWKRSTYLPHLTIAKNLNNNLDAAYRLFQHQNYTQTFTVDSVLLLKRNIQGRYEPLQKFPFLAQPSAQQEFCYNYK